MLDGSISRPVGSTHLSTIGRSSSLTLLPTRSSADADKPTRRHVIYSWVGRCAGELMHIFDFQNGGRPPSWIWYDVIADPPGLVFDGPNISS